MWSVNRLLCILYMASNGQSGLDNYPSVLFVLCLMFRIKCIRTTAKIWVLYTIPYRRRNADKRVKECRCTVRSRVDLCQESVNQMKLFCD